MRVLLKRFGPFEMHIAQSARKSEGGKKIREYNQFHQNDIGMSVSPIVLNQLRCHSTSSISFSGVRSLVCGGARKKKQRTKWNAVWCVQHQHTSASYKTSIENFEHTVSVWSLICHALHAWRPMFVVVFSVVVVYPIHNYQVYHTRKQLNVIKLNGWIFIWKTDVKHSCIHSTQMEATKKKKSNQFSSRPEYSKNNCLH